MPDDIHTQPLLVEIAIEAKSNDERGKLGVALAKLAAEDPSFRVSTDHEFGQTILKGRSESHLEGKINILKRTYKVDANVGAPQVAFRERVTRRAEVDYVHKKQSGGSGQFAGVSIVVEPNELGKGYEFESKIVGGAVPKEYIPGVEKGLESVLGAGVVAGFPVVDVKVQLTDGKYHDVELFGAGLRNRGACGIPRGAAEGQVGAARADHDDRGGHSGRLHRLGDRRSQLAARPDPRPGFARQCYHH